MKPLERILLQLLVVGFIIPNNSSESELFVIQACAKVEGECLHIVTTAASIVFHSALSKIGALCKRVNSTVLCASRHLIMYLNNGSSFARVPHTISTTGKIFNLQQHKFL